MGFIRSLATRWLVPVLGGGVTLALIFWLYRDLDFVLLLLVLDAGLVGYTALFVVIGAMMNGVTIGYLMEISPDDRRPAYSAYFNALASPAALLPLIGAGMVSLVSIHAVFVATILAALLQVLLLRRISHLALGEIS